MLPLWLQKALLYGHIGVLLEFYFTGAASLTKRHWKLTTSSYIWMVPVYGATALLLEVVSQSVQAPFYLKAFIYVPLIFGAEALSGAFLKAFTALLQRFLGGVQGGTVPWEYPLSKWSPAGLVNFRYTPFWLLVALAFDPITDWISRVIVMASRL